MQFIQKYYSWYGEYEGERTLDVTRVLSVDDDTNSFILDTTTHGHVFICKDGMVELFGEIEQAIADEDLDLIPKVDWENP